MLSLGIYGLANVVFMAGLTIKSKDSIITVMEEYKDQIEELFKIVQTTKNARAKSQLYKFYINCKYALVALDRESVECRRLKKVTPKYTELENSLKDCIHTLDQWVVMSALQFG
jgi:hypothetical protein